MEIMKVFIIVSVVVLAVIIVAAFFQWLWNITIPQAFDNAKKIEYWVAFRLLIIGAILSSGPFIRFG